MRHLRNPDRVDPMPSSLTRAERAFADHAVAIRRSPAHRDGTVGVYPVFAIQTPLPLREQYDSPEPGAPRRRAHVYQRRNGHDLVTIRAGLLPDADGHPTSVGLPYGAVARLLVLHCATAATRAKSRTVDLGPSLATFLRSLHLSTSGGPTSRSAYVQDQLLRLTRCTISVERTRTRGGRTTVEGQHLPPASTYRLWWSGDAAGGSLVLGDTFYRELTDRAVPLDLRKVHALRTSPFAIDLYAWLTYSAGRLAMSGRPEKAVSWRALHPQLGGGYADSPQGLKEFARAARQALARIRVLWPALDVATPTGRLVLRTRAPDIPFRTRPASR